ncbi:potassium channel subfamily K member 2-like [Oppia nitens]|uniref:potassium channel subfamily K member 2-like n=1 Tax=Oppia nitens TaxID=1686743 RepID=UPI0023DA3A97|nr:potassium channel subfamily K member 2-like [Oppia nitens]
MIPKAISMDFRQIALLLVFFIFYVIFGGTVFMYLESSLENQKRQEIDELLSDFTDKLQLINHPNITQDYITTMIQKLLVAQDMNLVDSYGNKTSFSNWSFFNSFFFAITVTTTIGYGHLTPYTVTGKIFCIIYALFGIPMTGLLIGGIGHRFSICFSNNISKAKTRYKRQISIRLMMLKKGLIFFVPWFLVFLVLPAVVFALIEDWTFLEGFYYCFVTLSTIGFGDYVAGSFEREYIWIYKLAVVLWIIFGLAYLSMILNFIGQGLQSRHLTNVVLSIRRISGRPPIKRKINQFRGKGRYKRQQSAPLSLVTENGKLITSDMSLNSAGSPSLSCPSPTFSQQPSFNDESIDESSSSPHHFFHILNIFPYFRQPSPSPHPKKTIKLDDDFLAVNTLYTSPRRSSSLPDIIENRVDITDDDDTVESDVLIDGQLRPNNNNSHNYVKLALNEKRKLFFVDFNHNPQLEVTSV